MKIFGIMTIYAVMVFFCYGVCKESNKDSGLPDIAELNVLLSCFWPITLFVYICILVYRNIEPVGENIAKRAKQSFEKDDNQENSD